MSDPVRPDDGPAPSGAPAGDDAGASGSVEVRVTDPSMAVVDLPEPPPRRRTAVHAIVDAADSVGEQVAHAANRVARAGSVVGDKVGASLSHLPVVPKTRRGRVMARSVVVSFLLVFSWIAVIVGLQLRGERPPDLRPDAERVLIALRDGKAGEVYEQASIRFQGVVRDRETFIDQMTEMNATLGRFVEVATVIGTKVNRGPGGTTSRIQMTLEYEKTETRGSLSFRREDGEWKLLGLAIEVPDAVAGGKEDRRERIQPRPDEIAALRAAVEEALRRSDRGDIEGLWAAAAPAFQQAITVEDLRRTEADRRASLGAFDRILDVSRVRINPRRNGASMVMLLQYANATITGNFELTRLDEHWRLVVYNLVRPVLQKPTPAATGSSPPQVLPPEEEPEEP